MSEHKKSIQSPNSSSDQTASADHADKLDAVLWQLCKAFNASPYVAFNKMQMVVEAHQIKCLLDMRPDLIGNAAFKIMHGGATATLLDSIDGIVAMSAIYQRSSQQPSTELVAKLTRLVTVDMRVDYIAPGKGTRFVGTAEVLRIGRQGCTTRMYMHNNTGKLIATGIATYAY